MSNQKLLFFILLIGYIFAPTLFNWMIAPTGVWYKPFIIWLMIILGAYLLQRYKKT